MYLVLDYLMENGHTLQNTRGICSWKGGSLLWILWPERLTRLRKQVAKFTTLTSLSGRNFVWKFCFHVMKFNHSVNFLAIKTFSEWVTCQETDPYVWGQPQYSRGSSQQLLWTWAQVHHEFTETAAYQLAWVTAFTFSPLIPGKVGCLCVPCLPIVNIPSDILQNSGE